MKRTGDRFLILLFVVVSGMPAFADDSACTYFYERLTDFPHSKLNLRRGVFESLLDGKPVSGCEVIFKSHESIVSGEKVSERFESLTLTPGWGVSSIADGPGSSTVVIERDKRRCILHWSQHAWVDEASKEIKQSKAIEVLIQCF